MIQNEILSGDFFVFVSVSDRSKHFGVREKWGNS
jgi:hypothetical protein